MLIREIVDKITAEWLPSTNELSVAKHPVGINSRVQDIIKHLARGGSNDVVMVGIWGMGGLGKTTAAKAIYNQIHHKFQFKSFLADVSDITSKHGMAYLQGKLVSDILNQTNSQISSVAEGSSQIKHHLRRRRVLVIMDNIDQVEQRDAIAGNHDWFGPGSRIIITTRDQHLLKQVDKTYPAQKLNEGEALELFCWHAFGNSWPNEGYLELSKKFVSYCGGLPLALEVLGSFLIKRTIAEWKSQLEKLERTSDGKIIKPLRISFEGLDDTQKAIFLDISYFFIGWEKDYVAKVLDGCDFFATIGISVLRERCLVTIEHNKLNMHDLLREMARVIISEKFPCHPGKWSRLSNHRDVTDVLRKKSVRTFPVKFWINALSKKSIYVTHGTEEVEGLALDFSHLSLQSSDKSSFSTGAFANMKKLRLLQLKNVQLKGKYKHLPKELIWLCWHGFPLQTIPNDFFNQPRLVVLEMHHSKMVQVWKGSKSLQKLKIIDLSWSYFLTKSPDFSQVPNLEELILECCWSLSEIHPSIGHLKRLSLVNLRSCYELNSLPMDFYKSKSVETLYLNGCVKFREYENLGEIISLRILEAGHTAIRQVPYSLHGLYSLRELNRSFSGLDLHQGIVYSAIKRQVPPSIVRLNSLNLSCLSLQGVKSIRLPHSLHGLNSLRELNLSQCKLADDVIPEDLGSLISLQDLDLQGNDFHTLPSLSGLPKLETLWLSGCRYLHTIPNLPTNLKFLYAFDCHALETMPNFLEMSNMRELGVSDSPKLTEVPGLDKSLNSMTLIDMSDCTNLTADFRKNILQGWTSCGFGGIFLNGNYVPDWFEFVNEGPKVSFDNPPSDDRNFEGLIFVVFYRSYISYPHPPLLTITVINNTKRTELQGCITIKDSASKRYGDDYLWQGQLSNDKLNFQGEDKVDIFFEIPLEGVHYDYSITIKRTGVNLVWDKPMKENQHDLDKACYVFDRHPSRFYGDASSSSSDIL